MLDFGHNFSIMPRQKWRNTQTPYMTGYTTPYGRVTASNNYNASIYPPWKAFQNSLAGNSAWITQLITDLDTVPPDGHWIQWALKDEELSTHPMMVPTSVLLFPRGSMGGDWYSDNNPRLVKIYGVKADDTVEILTEYTPVGWIGSGSRTIEINTNTEYKGLRVAIPETKAFTEGRHYHTALGKIVFYGRYRE
jgi:hypothetical protein